MNQMVVDIETMAIGPTAAVVAIGARLFEGYQLKKGFEVFIHSTLASQYGTVDHETMKWWSTQPNRDEVFSGQIHPADAAFKLAEFIREHDVKLVWANSPSFDCVILQHMFQQTGVKWPFSHRDERDCRTLFALQRELEIDCADLWDNTARRKHVPLDDATTQAEVVVRTLKCIVSSRAVPVDPGFDPRLSGHGPTSETASPTALLTGP